MSRTQSQTYPVKPGSLEGSENCQRKQYGWATVPHSEVHAAGTRTWEWSPLWNSSTRPGLPLAAAIRGGHHVSDPGRRS